MASDCAYGSKGATVARAVARGLLLAACLCLGACASRGGHYYQDDGPPDHAPAGLAQTPDAVPRIEPLNPRANRPYAALGRSYTPDTGEAPFDQRGMASWYGRQYHGNPTASGEPYDMFAMTAAHPTLPIPSYARVTRVNDGRSVIVRINDRGPFVQDRVIDLSFAAATRLGIVGPGSGEVTVHKITARDIAAGSTGATPAVAGAGIGKAPATPALATEAAISTRLVAAAPNPGTAAAMAAPLVPVAAATAPVSPAPGATEPFTAPSATPSATPPAGPAAAPAAVPATTAAGAPAGVPASAPALTTAVTPVAAPPATPAALEVPDAPLAPPAVAAPDRAAAAPAPGSDGGPSASASSASAPAGAGTATPPAIALPPVAAPPAVQPAPAAARDAGAPVSAGGRWAVQLGAFAVQANAEALRDQMSALLAKPEAESVPAADRHPRIEFDGKLHHVLVGAYDARAAAQGAARALQRYLARDTSVVRR